MVDFISLSLLEKDTHGDVLFSWCFPSCSYKEYLVRRSRLEGTFIELDFHYGRTLDKQWYYVLTTAVGADDSNLPSVSAFSLVLVTRSFNPERAHALLEILSARYAATGDITGVMGDYLVAMTAGSFKSEWGAFDAADFPDRDALLQGCLRDVIKLFEVESIIIYTALMLKKRVLLYSPELETMLDVTRSLPLLVWHRQCASLLMPAITSDPADLTELGNLPTFIAGSTENLSSHSHLWDVFVDVGDETVTVNPSAQEDLQMGKLHKDIAKFLVTATEAMPGEEEGWDDQEVVKKLALKTKEVLANLKSLADTDGNVTREALAAKQLPRSIENFLYKLSVAERA